MESEYFTVSRPLRSVLETSQYNGDGFLANSHLLLGAAAIEIRLIALTHHPIVCKWRSQTYGLPWPRHHSSKPTIEREGLSDGHSPSYRLLPDTDSTRRRARDTLTRPRAISQRYKHTYGEQGRDKVMPRRDPPLLSLLRAHSESHPSPWVAGPASARPLPITSRELGLGTTRIPCSSA